MEELEIRESISSGIFFQYVNSFSYVLVAFVFYIYLIHFYTSELVGIVALLLAITSILNIVFTLGINYGLQHFISYHLGKGEFDAVRGLIKRFSVVGVGLSAASFVFLYFTSPIFATLFFHSLRYATLMRFLGIELFFMVTSTLFSSILIGLQNFKSQAVFNIIGMLISYSLPVILLFLFNNPIYIVVGWALGFAFSAMAYGIKILEKLRSINGNVTQHYRDRIFSYSFPLLVSSLIGYGSSYVDRFVVSYLLNLSLLGIYNFALLISSAIGFIGGPFATIMLPKLSEAYGLENYEDFRSYVAKGIELISSIYVPIAMLVASLSSSILLFLSSGEYLPATIPVMIVLISSSAFISGGILVVSLQGIRKTRIFLLTSSLGLISNFVLSILLIPRFQMIGAAIGYSSISIVPFGILYHYTAKFRILRLEWRKLGKIYLSSIIMFTTTFLLQSAIHYSPLRLFFMIFLGFVIYIGMMKMLRTFDKEDIDFIMVLMPDWIQKIKSVFSILFL
ncbi:MAG: oligosaccharide flippase family protein [Candidatus Thermoplasmatota archaeon]|jgi:O-antigen/teichoic acid export membrane protein|nr:oligosaccharide flippase family protein [Candidatus Thermoplasmatota archaeon]MCL5789206.1 oligosaccharide flippase family protein [Candidatus Thermoplasmatota archaeon]